MPLTVPTVRMEKVAFTDSDGDEVVFQVSGTEMSYSVNGTARPPFKEIKWHPALGVPGIAMPDIHKGFPLPQKNLAGILGGLRYLAGQAKITCEIPESVCVSIKQKKKTTTTTTTK